MKRAERSEAYELLDGEEVRRYVFELLGEEPSILGNIRLRQESAGVRPIQLSYPDTRHLAALVAATQPKHIVEFGTLCGYSAVALLLAAPSDATVDTFEIDPHHAALAALSFREAGVAERVRIHLGDVNETLAHFHPAAVDFCLIDGGFKNYPRYLEWAEQHLRVGGVVVADNAFHFGNAAQGDTTSESTVAVRQMNSALFGNPRFQSTMLPTGEGLAVGVKVR